MKSTVITLASYLLKLAFLKEIAIKENISKLKDGGILRRWVLPKVAIGKFFNNLSV
jgi:hypothetical protein